MKRALKNLDKPLLITMIIFFAFGVVMVLSASSMESYMRYGNSPYVYFYKQLIFVIAGFILFFFLILFPTKTYKKIANMLIFLIIAMLIGLTIYGSVANNAQSWFNLGPISIQPSEFAKVFIIIYLAVYYDKNKENLNNQWPLIKPLLVCALIASLIIIQPDLGTAGIVILLTLLMFYALPISRVYRSSFTKILIGGIAVVAIILVATGGSILKDYQLQRFNFIDPCERYKEESGYQLCNSFIAFTNGGLTGKGIGGSTQKYLYLPESYTDFIYPIIVEEWGLILGIVILAAYVFVLYRIFNIARRATNLKNSLLAYGVFIYILLHITINLSGVMGLLPLTGVPLPFLSYGGSYTISLFIALAIVERVAIENNLAKMKKN